MPDKHVLNLALQNCTCNIILCPLISRPPPPSSPTPKILSLDEILVGVCVYVHRYIMEHAVAMRAWVCIPIHFARTNHGDMHFIVLQPSPFSSPASSLFKLTSMTAGDFSFNTILGFESDGMISFPTISYIAWILFIIVMPILFTNLLVSKNMTHAVHNIHCKSPHCIALPYVDTHHNASQRNVMQGQTWILYPLCLLVSGHARKTH